ncbi:hypothetical protein EMCRGX_G032977 [Ephydatia muelleri]
MSGITCNGFACAFLYQCHCNYKRCHGGSQSSSNIAPVIAGVVVTLIAMVTLGIVGAVTAAVCIDHKRSKMNTALPLETDFHNPVYSSSGIPDAKGSSVLVSDYELLAMEYEVLKEREQSSMYATLEPETVYHEV